MCDLLAGWMCDFGIGFFFFFFFWCVCVILDVLTCRDSYCYVILDVLTCRDSYYYVISVCFGFCIIDVDTVLLSRIRI
jgi:hypothetical protein